MMIIMVKSFFFEIYLRAIKSLNNNGIIPKVISMFNYKFASEN